MIVCHCTAITDQDIRNAVSWMRAADPQTVITPGKVWRALGKRADCGGCLPLFLDTLGAADGFGVPAALRRLRRGGMGKPGEGASNEGRSEGHRLSERGAAV